MLIGPRSRACYPQGLLNWDCRETIAIGALVRNLAADDAKQHAAALSLGIAPFKDNPFAIREEIFNDAFGLGVRLINPFDPREHNFLWRFRPAIRYRRFGMRANYRRSVFVFRNRENLRRNEARD